MITRWLVSNFKSIREETELEMGPLTIFAGANSSGKSTFIQSVLLIAQTLAHKVGSRSVVLNGTLASLGQYDDLKSHGGESDQIVIKCTCRPLTDGAGSTVRRSRYAPLGAIYFGRRVDRLQEIDCEISFDADPSSTERDLLQIQPRLFSTRLSSRYRDEDNVDQTVDISIRYSTKAISEIEGGVRNGEIDDQLRGSLAYDVDLQDAALAEIHENFRSAEPIGCILRHFLPERIVYSIDTIQEEANSTTIALRNDSYGSFSIARRRGKDVPLTKDVIKVINEILMDTLDYDLVFKDKPGLDSLLESDQEVFTLRTWYDYLDDLPHSLKTQIQETLQKCEELYDRIYAVMMASISEQLESRDLIEARPPRMITEATYYLDDFFASSLKYLGPLRDAPKPLYPLTPTADPSDVGLRGEHTASILELHKNKKIRYIPSSSFNESEVDQKTISRTLERAVTDWLQYLGVADSVRSRDQGKLGHELKVGFSDLDSMQDLTHVGVGVSQVLPILVMCLLADRDSTLVLEQPELHLHPKVQTLLGDFFLSMALCSKQCIVETHSEYLIDRLRFRIAAAPLESNLTNQAKIYFVEKTDQSSSFREVVVNDFGAINDWPDGFFDQSQKQTEEILRAAALKRRTSGD